MWDTEEKKDVDEKNELKWKLEMYFLIIWITLQTTNYCLRQVKSVFIFFQIQHCV